MYRYLLTLLMGVSTLLFAYPLAGQTPEPPTNRKITFALAFGPAFHSDRGGNFAVIRDAMREFRREDNDSIAYQSGFHGRRNLDFGISGELAMNDWLSLGMGIRFTGRGFKFRMKETYRSSQVKYDAIWKYSEKVRVPVVTIPFYARVALPAGFSLSGGLDLNMVMRGQSKLTWKLEQDVIINGEWDEEYSLEAIRDTADLSPYLKGAIPGVSLALSKKIGENFDVVLQSSLSPNYLNNSLGGTTISTGILIRYRIPGAIPVKF
jgi:hypothetical protein